MQNDSALKLIDHFRRMKEGIYHPIKFKINADNRQLWTSLPVDEVEDCPGGTAFTIQHERIE